MHRIAILNTGYDSYDCEQESASRSPELLIIHHRIVTTPHIAWHSDYAMKELQKRAAENMIAPLSGQPIRDEL